TGDSGFFGGGFGGDGGPAGEARLRFPEGVAADAAGNVYIADAGNDLIRRVSPPQEGMVDDLDGDEVLQGRTRDDDL
ncbi:MAG: hypothetical protein OXG35_27095, partial [Acidobacteria bacterium]|nr:hypothetical protein [Acidobacteriota bacterium]